VKKQKSVIDQVKIYQPYTLEELAAVFDGKIAFKEQIARAAERVRKIGLHTLPKQGK
jgi:hypothetical protein